MSMVKKGDGEQKRLFSNRDLGRLIFPLIVEQILAVSVGMVDTVMVSSAGEAATSGVSLVDMINVLFINIFAAVATGGAVISSQYLGQKKMRRACEAADQLVLITGLLAVVIMGGKHSVPQAASHPALRQSGGGRDGKCADLSHFVGFVLPVFGGLQLLRRIVPFHGEFEDFHGSVHCHECDQCDRRLYADFYFSLGGRGGRCRFPGVTDDCLLYPPVPAEQ